MYEELRGHTGAMVLLVKGSAYIFSTNQKINWMISTEDYLIGVDNSMPNIFRSKHFIDSQGCTVDNLFVSTEQERYPLRSF